MRTCIALIGAALMAVTASAGGLAVEEADLGRSGAPGGARHDGHAAAQRMTCPRWRHPEGMKSW